MRTIGAVVLAVLAGAASAQRFDPGALKSDIAGGRNEVLVLGTPHLSTLPKAFEPAMLAPLLDRLAAWRPQVVTVESLSGAQCDQIRRYATSYPKDTADTYCFDPAPAHAATGLDVPAATAEMARLLKAWPAAPIAPQRRHLAAVMLAAGDPASAYVQWLRLPPAERRAGDGLDAALVAQLAGQGGKRNESSVLAAALAARLGLERVFPVDDHTADAGVDDTLEFGAALDRIWKNPATARRTAADDALTARLGAPGGVLALYRYYNAPEQARIAYESDFGAALKDRAPGLYGRAYADWWQVRNLRMVANVVAAAATRPGARVLCVVGASHKGYFEAYLDRMHDVTIADAEAVLR